MPTSPACPALMCARAAATAAASGSGQPRDSVSGVRPPAGTHSTSRWRLMRRACRLQLRADLEVEAGRSSSPKRSASAAISAVPPGARGHQPLEPAGERRAELVRAHGAGR